MKLDCQTIQCNVIVDRYIPSCIIVLCPRLQQNHQFAVALFHSTETRNEHGFLVCNFFHGFVNVKEITDLCWISLIAS